MSREIKIDQKRLSVVESLKNRERGIYNDANDVVRQLRNERNGLISQRRSIEETAPTDRQTAMELHQKKQSLTARIDDLGKELEIAIGMQRAAEENFQASIAVSENCEKYLGGGHVR